MVLNGTWAASFTSLVTDALGASNRHMQRDSLGRKVLRMRRTAYHHPEGNSYIERFHRSLKEEEVWVSEYRSLEEARASIERYIWEYNHDRPHRSLGDRTPWEAFQGFESDLKIEALSV